MNRLDLPEELRAHIVSITRADDDWAFEVVVKRGHWFDGIERSIEAAIINAVGGHDGIVVEEQPWPADDPTPSMTMRADDRHFLSSRAWLSLRYRVLKKYGARCQACGRGARDGAIVQVDHIKPRSRFPELALRIDNLQVLCRDCNFGKGTADTTDWRPRRVVVAAHE